MIKKSYNDWLANHDVSGHKFGKKNSPHYVFSDAKKSSAENKQSPALKSAKLRIINDHKKSN